MNHYLFYNLQKKCRVILKSSDAHQLYVCGTIYSYISSQPLTLTLGALSSQSYVIIINKPGVAGAVLQTPS